MPTAARAMTEVADRLERAIEGRADVEHEIERGEQQAPPRARLARTVFWLAVTGVSLYLVAPSIVEVLGSWSDLDTLAPAWLQTVADYNPFSDTGGDQSFAIALLDSLGNGVVLSSLHSRTDTRVFAKAVQNGRSKYQLSDEEQDAIKKALAPSS